MHDIIRSSKFNTPNLADDTVTAVYAVLASVRHDQTYKLSTRMRLQCFMFPLESLSTIPAVCPWCRTLVTVQTTGVHPVWRTADRRSRKHNRERAKSLPRCVDMGTSLHLEIKGRRLVKISCGLWGLKQHPIFGLRNETPPILLEAGRKEGGAYSTTEKSHGTMNLDMKLDWHIWYSLLLHAYDD